MIDHDVSPARGLHMVSRRVPASLLALAVAAVALRVVLRWTPASGAYAVMFPLIVATAAATAMSMTTHSPLGETERVTGRWLPWLRLGTVRRHGRRRMRRAGPRRGRRPSGHRGRPAP